MNLIETRQKLEADARALHVEVCEVLLRAVEWIEEAAAGARGLASPTSTGGAPLVPSAESIATVRAGLGEATKAVGYLAVLAGRHEATVEALADVAAAEEREREAARQGNLSLAGRVVNRVLDDVAKGAMRDPSGKVETTVTARGRTVRTRKDGTIEDSGGGEGKEESP